MDAHTTADRQLQMDQLLAHLPAGVVVHGPDGRVRCANGMARELLGVGDADLTGRQADAASWCFVRTDASTLPAADYPVNLVLRSGGPVRDLIIGVPGNLRGPLRWLLCTAYPSFDASGVLCQVVVCFTDCTALKRAKQKLEKSEERLRLVLQGSTDAPWDWDVETNEVYYSERWWTMLGYAPGDPSSAPDFWMSLAHPDDRPALNACRERLLNGHEQTYSIEFRLRHRDGHYLPVLARGFVLRDGDGKALRISGTNTDLTERKEAERRIYALANFDQLTGLPNRRHVTGELANILARCHRTGQFGAVLIIDLDQFKLVNETLGHDAGDALLRQVSDRLRQAGRSSDLVGRLGANDFVIVLEDLGHAVSHAVAAANMMISHLLAELKRPYLLSGKSFDSTPSIGVTMFDTLTAGGEVVLKQANLAMQQAKADRHQPLRFFDPAMQAEVDKQAALTRALRDHISVQQFVIFCQPQVSMAGHVTGAEALVRWRHPGGDLLAPGEFIGLAESCGLIAPLGRHVLEESCRALARWEHDAFLSTVKLGVNVSVDQLHDPAFPALVAGILAQTNAPAHKLCLEITESVFAADVAELRQHMQQLRLLGVHFSLDDFGTGYSSLAYLNQFPLSALKIDRSFVRNVHVDPNAVTIVEAIIALARALKLDIVAEGVEHEAQRRVLAAMGCTALQGYMLGRPVPLAQFEREHCAIK